MSEVWKFQPNPLADILFMPRGAKPLHVHEQDGTICLWALVDSTAPYARHRVVVICTGQPVLLTDEYVGSAHLFDEHGNLVFHVFYGGESQ